MVRARQIPAEPTLIAGTLGSDSCAPVTRKSLMEIPILVVQSVFTIIIAIRGKFCMYLFLLPTTLIDCVGKNNE